MTTSSASADGRASDDGATGVDADDTERRLENRMHEDGPLHAPARFELRDGSEFWTVLWDSLPEQTFLVETPALPESLFIDPDPDALRASAEMGVDAVELHTGEYANAAPRDRSAQLTRLHEAARLGRELGLAVHAGHGLTYRNIHPIAATGAFSEFNIGHSIIARAMFVGVREAVREMKRLLDRAEDELRVEKAEDLPDAFQTLDLCLTHWVYLEAIRAERDAADRRC